MVGHLRGPTLNHALLRQPIKRVVDLDDGKLARVVAEHPVVFEVVRVERPFPFLEREAAGAGLQNHETLTAASGFWLAMRLAFSASMRSMIFPPPSMTGTSDVMS